MKIEKDNYQGYLWMSDAQKPVKIDGEFEMEISDDALPFVVEGMIATTTKSIMIKYVDGKHLVKEFPLDEKAEYVEETYEANRIEDVKGLIFRRYWKEELDKLYCLNMNVLTPAELVFAGFKR